ncbi:MAG: 30S ribosomal protein S17 [Elusimicrobia bacterium]|nr:30S ribosomal protein S17 [Elusimicrobiota bacterium]
MAVETSRLSRRVKTRSGIVVSDRMNKTRVVEIITSVRHPIYEKVLRQERRFYAHDEGNESHAGDKVLLEETRPLSRTKRWRVVKILEKSRF